MFIKLFDFCFCVNSGGWKVICCIFILVLGWLKIGWLCVVWEGFGCLGLLIGGWIGVFFWMLGMIIFCIFVVIVFCVEDCGCNLGIIIGFVW